MYKLFILSQNDSFYLLAAFSKFILCKLFKALKNIILSLNSSSNLIK